MGILLYLAIDLPHAQHAIRHLSTGMSCPTKQLKDILRHLVSFLSGTKDLHLCLKFRGDDAGLHHCYTQQTSEAHLEIFSDSDWGSNKGHRKSVSSGYIYFGSALLYSSSRTQRVISLSSAEAEVYAASSSACDGVLIAKLVKFCTGQSVVLHHLMDSAAARGILARQGVGRIRHLSCRILWLQQLVKQRGKIMPTVGEPELFHVVSGVSGSDNVSDLGTKRLGKTRLSELMHYCGFGYIIGEMFVPFNEEVSQVKQTAAMIRTLKKGSATVASIIAHASLIQSALGHTAMDSCSATNSADVSCLQIVSDSTSSWCELLPMMIVTLVVLATGFAFYKWLNRGNADQNDEGDNMAIESHEAKVARYNCCGISEVSDPDFWMELRHFENDPLADDEADGGGPVGFDRWFRKLAHESRSCFAFGDAKVFHRDEYTWTYQSMASNVPAQAAIEGWRAW